VHPGEELTDEEFLEAYRLNFKSGGIYGVGRPDRGYDYAYNTGEVPNAWGFWHATDIGRQYRVGHWEPLRDERLLGLLKMIIFPEVIE
jgi:hypothetical protein